MAKRITADKNPNWMEIAVRFADNIEKTNFLSKKIWKRQEFIDWFIFRVKLLGLLFDWKLIARCYYQWKEIRNEKDHFTVIVGNEGDGKTTLSVQMSAWVAPDMVLEDICFDMEQYVNRLRLISKDYKKNKREGTDKSITIDEGGISLFSREAMSKSNTVLAKTFMVQRFLNANVSICIPYYWGLDTMIRQHRIKTLIIIKERGKYECIVGKGIKILNERGKRDKDKELWRIPIPYGLFWEGDFSKPFPRTISKDDYEKYKSKHIKKFLDDAQLEAQSVKMIKVGKLEKEFGISRETIIKEIKNEKIGGRKIGNQWFVTEKAYKQLIME